MLADTFQKAFQRRSCIWNLSCTNDGSKWTSCQVVSLTQCVVCEAEFNELGDTELPDDASYECMCVCCIVKVGLLNFVLCTWLSHHETPNYLTRPSQHCLCFCAKSWSVCWLIHFRVCIGGLFNEPGNLLSFRILLQLSISDSESILKWNTNWNTANEFYHIWPEA